ncbi:peptidylprolyl isomerase [Chromatiaceae bacterium AAb-1]|nr:peptidylprolyl isomerase [Chromatiaceae bacterium AAb-1]
MLEKIRDGSQGIIAKSILGLVILTFALAGVGSYLSTTTEQPVAVVNGEDISRTAFDQAFQNERNRMQEQFGDMYNMLAADTAYMNSFRNDVLERLIDETLQKQYARKLGVSVSDEQIRDTIRQMPEFQVDGRFNNERYLALLRQAGYQPNEFRDLLRDQLSRNQLLVGLFGSEFATVSEMQLLAKLQQQTRDIQFATIKASAFASDVAVTDGLLQDYYITHIQQYETEEKVAVEYVELSAAVLAAQIDVTEQQVADYYNAHKAQYGTAERRQVAHIMLESEQDDSAVAAQAAELLQQLQQGADFAELARTHSADTFSAENGGVLGWLEKGDLDEQFEQAAYELSEAGQLSDVVRSSYGYHIIKLVTLEPASTKPLAEVAAEIAERIKSDEAAEHFYELQQRLTEIAFEVPDNLDEAASVLDGKVKNTPLFSRREATVPLNHPQVLNRIYDADFIREGLNSDVIEIEKQHVVVVRVKEHEQARTRTLEEVKTDVQAAVIAEQAAKLATEKAQALLSSLSQSSFAELVTEAGLTLEDAKQTPRFGGTLDTEVRTKAFALARPAAEQPSVDVVTLSNGDVALVAVTAVHDAEVTVVPDASQLERLSEQQAELSFATVIAALKAEAKITRHLRAEQVTSEDF